MGFRSAFILLQFSLATVLPAIVSAILWFLGNKTRLGKMGYWPTQIICGILFGLVAIYGTEAGIVTDDATMNVRDAAPIVAGLYFGGPAGIIAGLIGGVERWFAALWGRGMFTRDACSLATILAGFYAALLRRQLFRGRKSSWPLAMAVGLVIEVLHLLLVFLTNLDDSMHAFIVVRACTFPMIICNALAVALSGAVLTKLGGFGRRATGEAPDISQKVQVGMLSTVLAGFAMTLFIVGVLQSGRIESSSRTTLSLVLQETEDDIQDASDANLLELAYEVADEIPSVRTARQETVDELVKDLDITELHVIDDRGIIVMSSDDVFVGFNMASGEQSSEFMRLLPGGNLRFLVQKYQPMAMNSAVWRKYAGVSIPDGVLQVGYDAEHFVDNLTDEVRIAVANRHVGSNGFLAVFNRHDGLVGVRSGMRIERSDVRHLSDAMISEDPGTLFEIKYHGMDYFAMYRTTEGLRVLAMLPASEAIMERDVAILITSFMEILIFAALFVAIYVLIERVVVSSIWRVNGRLDEITNGDLTVEVDVRDSAEFAILSDDINATVAALRNAIAAESARIESDLATAKAIQESALPRTFPPFPDVKEFDIYASMSAAREVGGDFYDFFFVDAHTVCFLIADVSGKGIPASLFMMAAKSELANYIKSGMQLAEAVQSANWNLCQGNEAGMFVTVWAGTLDYATGELTYVNAGHNPPLLRHDGTWEWLKERGGLFLGTFETARYKSFTRHLVPGDEIFLYTDGVNEAFSAEGEEYGSARLEALLGRHADLHPKMLVDVVRADVRTWAKGAEQSDDITTLCLEYGHQPQVSGNIRVNADDYGCEELVRRQHYEFSQLRCPVHVQRKIELATRELFGALCEHGRAGASGLGEVDFTYQFDTDPRALTMCLTARGEAYDPLAYTGIGGQTAQSMAMAHAIAGMDDAAYVRDGDDNVVAFRKLW